MAQQTQTVKDKKKKKYWYTVVAPQDFQSVKLGETPAFTAQDLIGKVLHINLMTLTNDPKKQAVNLSFKIVQVSQTTAVTNLFQYSLNTAHIKRLIRKASDKIEESFLVTTKDNFTYRIKPIFFTRHEVSNSLLTALRKKITEHLQHALRELTSTEIFTQLISNKLQAESKSALKKTYPVSLFEIKSFVLVSASPLSQPVPVSSQQEAAPDIQPVEPSSSEPEELVAEAQAQTI
jgi:ribosomal protein S3AE